MILRQKYGARLAFTSTEKLFGVPLSAGFFVLLPKTNKPYAMYERKIPVDLECPLRLTMSLINAKWKSCIIDELRHRPLRPSEIHRLFPEASPRVLDIQLKELAADGLVQKTLYSEVPPRSEYALTPLGASLVPIIDSMLAWGEKNMELFERKYGSVRG